MDVLDAVCTVPHCAGLSADDREALSRAFRVQEHADGHVFVRQGASGDTAFVLLEGEVAVLRGAEEINRLGPGALFGLVALVDDEPRSATCRAVGRTRVASLPRSAFSLLFHRSAPIAWALQRALADQLTKDFRNLDRRIREALSRA